MMMFKFSVGNTWDNSSLDTIGDLNRKYRPQSEVVELYGSIPGITPTARAADRLPHREMGIPEIAVYVREARKLGIAIEWTLNSPYIGPTQDFGWDSLKSSLHSLYDVGIVRFVITHPLLMKLVRQELPGSVLEVSTIAEVESPEQVSAWHELGANNICGKHELNRNFEALWSIIGECHRLGMEYKVLANETCLPGPCVMRSSCYLASSVDSNRDLYNHWPFGYCERKRTENPSNLLRSKFILPQWIPLYSSIGVDTFKVTGRTLPSQVVLSILDKYMSLEWKGNLLDLFPGFSHLAGTKPQGLFISCEEVDKQRFLQYFLDHGRLCSLKSCHRCRYCEAAYQKTRRKPTDAPKT